DFPSPDASSPQRDTTTIPQQALFLMNNPFVIECARHLVQLPEVAAEKDCARRVERLYRRLYGRAPTAEEMSLARAFTGGMEPDQVGALRSGVVEAQRVRFCGLERSHHAPAPAPPGRFVPQSPRSAPPQWTRPGHARFGGSAGRRPSASWIG